jgi:hypothetical protein
MTLGRDAMLTDNAKQNKKIATMETEGKIVMLQMANGHQTCGLCAGLRGDGQSHWSIGTDAQVTPQEPIKS